MLRKSYAVVVQNNMKATTNVARIRKKIVVKGKYAFEVADRVAKKAASRFSMMRWPWWIEESVDTKVAGKYLVLCACIGDSGQLRELLKYFEKKHPDHLSNVLEHVWCRSDRDEDDELRSKQIRRSHRRRPRIGHTALTEAVLSRNCEIVRLLIQHGANLNVQDCNGLDLNQVSRFEDPELRRPHIEQITLMLEAARCDRMTSEKQSSPSKQLSSALLFASAYRSRTPKLSLRSFDLMKSPSRVATIQGVYMSRLSEGKSAHVCVFDDERNLKIEEDTKEKEKKKKKKKNRVEFPIEIQEHLRDEETSEHAERAIRQVSKRKKHLENAYDTIERLEIMLAQQALSSPDKVLTLLKSPSSITTKESNERSSTINKESNERNSTINKESNERSSSNRSDSTGNVDKRNTIVLLCLDRIRRNKLFASAFRRWSSQVMILKKNKRNEEEEKEENQCENEPSSEFWKQKYNETNKRLDKLQRKFDKVMPVLIAAAERAAGCKKNKSEIVDNKESHDESKNCVIM